MRPPERFPHDDPREWMNRARSNLIRAKTPIPEAYLEDLCFDAQQAAEKSIKAVMIKRDIDFPYVHDLRRLLALLQGAGEEVPPTVVQAENLTRYASDTRYPGTAEPVDEQRYRNAIQIANAVVRWAEDRLQ